MAEYYTKAEICKKLQVSGNTFIKMVLEGNLLAYRRNKPTDHTRPITRPTWYTNDELLTLSELMRCKKAQMELKERSKKWAIRKRDRNRTPTGSGLNGSGNG